MEQRNVDLQMARNIITKPHHRAMELEEALTQNGIAIPEPTMPGDLVDPATT